MTMKRMTALIVSLMLILVCLASALAETVADETAEAPAASRSRLPQSPMMCSSANGKWPVSYMTVRFPVWNS